MINEDNKLACLERESNDESDKDYGKSQEAGRENQEVN